MKKNDTFTIEITDLSEEGMGIGKQEGFVWFVKDAIPGDQVQAAATQKRRQTMESASTVESRCLRASGRAPQNKAVSRASINPVALEPGMFILR